MRLPHGANRNRTLRRPGETPEEMEAVEVERLFRRFWREYRRSLPAAGGDTPGGNP
jgi:hypothetical protein